MKHEKKYQPELGVVQVMEKEYPYLKDRVRVSKKPMVGYTFCARERKAGALIYIGFTTSDSEIMYHAARACMELIQHRTTAKRVFQRRMN